MEINFDYLFGNNGGGEITLKPLSVTENGEYTAPDGEAYTPVTVNVQPTLQIKTVDIEANASYTIQADSEYYGMDEVIVNVDVPSVSTLEITQEQYDALTEYNPQIIYLITQ